MLDNAHHYSSERPYPSHEAHIFTKPSRDAIHARSVPMSLNKRKKMNGPEENSLLWRSMPNILKIESFVYDV